MIAAGPNPYLQTKVLTASPAELQMMLLDGAIRFGEMAREGLATRDYEKAYVGTTRCQEILLELINGLRPEHDADLCRRLSGLYTFMYTRLLAGMSQRDVAMVDEVLKLLRFERETWQLLLDQLARENTAAGKMTQTPSAAPPIEAAIHAAVGGSDPSRVVGGTVSLRG